MKDEKKKRLFEENWSMATRVVTDVFVISFLLV